MLTHIYIRNFAIIDELDLDLYSGMTALTGETGAGKSILLDAIGLVLGDKANAQTVRHGTDRAEITLTVDTSHTPLAKDWLQAHALDVEDNTCILRRVVSKAGKSRAWINGSPTTLTLMRQLGEQMVEIHGQHEHHSLIKRDAQRQMLDEYANNTSLLLELKAVWKTWKTLSDRFHELTHQQQAYQERIDLLSFQAQELEHLNVEVGENDQLNEEHSRLAHAEQLRDTAFQSYHQLYEQEPSLYSQLSRITQDIEQLKVLDHTLNPAAELLNNAQIQVQESALVLRDYVDHLELDPERLQWVEKRMADIRQCARKYRMEADDLPNHLLQLQAELEQLNSDDYDLDALQKQIEKASNNYLTMAKRLSQARQEAAKVLSMGVIQAMQELGMQGSLFEIQVNANSQTAFNQLGIDVIDFMVSANPGQPLKPLSKVASGGELSRISLAIQIMAAQRVRLPALIFDEVDTGIGGGIAEVVGEKLCQLGNGRQVLCVTHLPQVASKAHHHYKVTKVKGENQTSTGITALDSTARIDEIARMIGGLEITSATKQLASEMLQ